MKTRKLAVAATCTAAMVALSGCGVGMGGTGTPTAGSQATVTAGAFDWQRFSGSSINVMLDQHPWSEALNGQIDAFTAATGIKVNVQSYAEDLYFDKMDQALRTANPPDVVMTGFDYSVSTQFEAGLLEPLTPYINNPSLTSSDYDLSDFPSGILAPAELPSGQPDQQLYGIPISTETYILFYNKDLVNQYLGGQLPATMDELTTDAAKITSEGGGKTFGSVMRGVRDAGIADIPTGLVLNEFPASHGDITLPYNVWWDGDWSKPRLTDPAIVKGLDDYAKLLAAGPPNKFNIDWPDANALFQQGKVVFYADASVFGPTFEDPTQSAIVGKVGYAPLPTGAEGGTTGLWSWGLSISAGSKEKGAAWLFTQWFTDKENTAKLGAATGGAPRQSSSTDPAYTSALNAEYVQTVTQAMSTARPTAVVSGNAEAALLVIVDAIIAMASGTDPAKAAQDAQTAIAKVKLP